MATWFETEPSIFQDEKSRLEELGFVLDEEKLKRERVVEFNGRSKADPRRALRVEFLSGYPSLAPEVYDDGKESLLRRHHHPQNRAFCLFGPNRNRWDCATMTAVDAVREAEELITKFGSASTTSTVENEVPEPVSDLLPTDLLGGFLIPPTIADGLDATVGQSFGTCQLFVATPKDGPVRGLMKSARLGVAEWRVPGFYDHLMNGQSGSVQNAALVRLDRTPPVVSGRGGFQSWIDLVPAEHRRQGKRPYEWLVFAYPEESGAASGHGISCTVLRFGQSGYACYRTFLLSRRRAFARIPGLEPLADKAVVILGVGALGSRIAVALAASGVRKFHLVDRDAYDTANAVRHACGIRFFGQPKVAAVASMILESNPLASGNITLQIARAGNMKADEQDQLIECLAAADLVIDATASEHAAHWLDHQCHRLGKPRLHATVTSGAWGGDVMRIIPEKTPCWVCQQVAHDMPLAEPRRDGGYYAPGCAHPTFTGNIAEVSIVADIAAAMAIETMLDSPQRDFAGSHVRWFARSESGRWAPRIEVVSSRARPTCPFCPPHLKLSGTSS